MVGHVDRFSFQRSTSMDRCCTIQAGVLASFNTEQTTMYKYSIKLKYWSNRRTASKTYSLTLPFPAAVAPTGRHQP